MTSSSRSHGQCTSARQSVQRTFHCPSRGAGPVWPRTRAAPPRGRAGRGEGRRGRGAAHPQEIGTSLASVRHPPGCATRPAVGPPEPHLLRYVSRPRSKSWVLLTAAWAATGGQRRGISMAGWDVHWPVRSLCGAPVGHAKGPGMLAERVPSEPGFASPRGRPRQTEEQMGRRAGAGQGPLVDSHSCLIAAETARPAGPGTSDPCVAIRAAFSNTKPGGLVHVSAPST